jgi:hypothetical protein
LLLDDTGSFAGFKGTVSSIFSDLVTSLQTALPDVNFAFGVARTKDYGGPGSSFSSDDPQSRPFILSQPIVTAATATADGTTLNSLISTALSINAPGYGGDTPEAYFEALYQMATGAGFDGNGNGNTTDSGSAGASATQSSPGSSGDIPAFATNTLPTSGSLGGMGWRPGALHLILFAGDTAPVAPFLGSIPTMITGAGGSSVPVSALENPDGRFGLVSSAKSLGAGSNPDAVAPLGAATVQQTVSALNALGIRVLSMGPGAAPTNSTASLDGPSVWESAIARLTGALDNSGNPLVFSMSVSNSELTGAIANAVKATSTAPVDVGLATSSLPSGLTFSGAPGVVPSVGPGGTASFKITVTVPSLPYSGKFDLNFIDVHSDAVLGVIPVTINIPLAVDPPGPAPEVISGQRLGFHEKATTLVLTFSAGMDTQSAEDLNNYVIVGPKGNTIKIKSAIYDATTHKVWLRPSVKLKLRDTYLLRVRGATADGITSATGVPLDGTGTGLAGQDYLAKVFWWKLKPVTPDATTSATTHAQVNNHPRKPLVKKQ